MTTLKTIFIRLLILIIATVFLVWLIDTTKILTNHTGTPNYEAITGILKENFFEKRAKASEM